MKKHRIRRRADVPKPGDVGYGKPDPGAWDRAKKDAPPQPQPKNNNYYDPETNKQHGKQDAEKKKIEEEDTIKIFKEQQKNFSTYLHTLLRNEKIREDPKSIADLFSGSKVEWFHKKREILNKLKEYWEDIPASARKVFLNKTESETPNFTQWIDKKIIANAKNEQLKRLNAKFEGKQISRTATINYLDETTSFAVTQTLNILLKEYLKFGMLLKQAHWNTKGMSFAGLHPLYDAAYDHAIAAQDMLAERCVQLGVPADGTPDSLCATMPYVGNKLGFLEKDYVVIVSQKAKALSTLLYSYIEAMVEFDNASADVLIEISRQLDKDLWQIEAHIEDPASPVRMM